MADSVRRSAVAARTSSQRSAAAVVLWPIAAFSFTYHVLEATRQPQGYDTRPVWAAAHSFLRHESIYSVTTPHAFVYPPSSLFLFAPLGVGSFTDARFALFVVNVAAVVAAAGLTLRFFGFRVASFVGAATLLGLSVFLPFLDTLGAGNVNGVVLLLGTLGVGAALRDRQLAAGVFLGLSLSAKPVLGALLLLPLLHRQWKTLIVAVALPLLLSLAALPLTVGASTFVHQTIPYLLHGESRSIQGFNVSISGAMNRFGVHTGVAELRGLVLILLMALIWRLFTEIRNRDLKDIELASVALVASFLCFSFSWEYYALYLLPVIISVAVPGSSLRSWLGGVAIYLVAATDVWDSDRLPARLREIAHQRATFGFAFVAVAIAASALARSRAAEPGPASLNDLGLPDLT